MNKTIEKAKTLLVDGPASVTMLSGKAEVFGSKIKEKQKIVIREGKRLPFTVEEISIFEISLGAEACAEETEGNTIPKSWVTAYELLCEYRKKPVTIMVVGGVDSGKTSFCTYLANRMVTEKHKVAVLDEDLGQSDIGPPATVGYAHVSKPVTDLFNLKPENTYFIGSTSPSQATEKTIQGVEFLRAEILNKATADFVVVNTDGWMTGNEASIFKTKLADAVEPDIVFCLESENELPSLCAMLGDALGKYVEERVDSPRAVRERNRETRRSLRELGFVKYLQNARIKVFALNYLTIEGKENYALISQRKAENLLIGLYDGQKRFLGIGVIREVDYTRKALKVLTSVVEKPASLLFGKVRLDENLREIQEKTDIAKITG